MNGAKKIFFPFPLNLPSDTSFNVCFGKPNYVTTQDIVWEIYSYGSHKMNSHENPNFQTPSTVSDCVLRMICLSPMNMLLILDRLKINIFKNF